MIAVQTHQKEKHLALKNALINHFCFSQMKEDIQLTFIKFVDELEPSHIRLLNFINAHEGDFFNLDCYQSVFEQYAKSSNVEIKSDEFQMLMQDLAQRNLLKISSSVTDLSAVYAPDHMITETSDTENLPRLRVTSVGKSFLQFITYHVHRELL